mmetsp:Transcript_90163/g.232752  ORF Transcript_90163/g.232752 Transcript_90163/m.232752 type:complete len:217 (-) Transcript_90163:202-852(-)
MRFSPRSSRENVGTVWKRRQPTDISIASPLFSTFGCQRWRFTRTCTWPIRISPGSRPPRMSGRSRLISATQAAGTSSRRMRTKVAMPAPSVKASPGASLVAFGAFSPSAASSPPAALPSLPSLPSPPSPGSFSSSSSALLQPPVMNLRFFRSSILAETHASRSPGSDAMRVESTESRSPRFPRRPPSAACDARAESSMASSSPASASSSSKSASVR